MDEDVFREQFFEKFFTSFYHPYLKTSYYVGEKNQESQQKVKEAVSPLLFSIYQTLFGYTLFEKPLFCEFSFEEEEKNPYTLQLVWDPLKEKKKCLEGVWKTPLQEEVHFLLYVHPEEEKGVLLLEEEMPPVEIQKRGDIFVLTSQDGRLSLTFSLGKIFKIHSLEGSFTALQKWAQFLLGRSILRELPLEAEVSLDEPFFVEFNKGFTPVKDLFLSLSSGSAFLGGIEIHDIRADLSYGVYQDKAQINGLEGYIETFSAPLKVVADTFSLTHSIEEPFDVDVTLYSQEKEVARLSGVVDKFEEGWRLDLNPLWSHCKGSAFKEGTLLCYGEARHLEVFFSMGEGGVFSRVAMIAGLEKIASVNFLSEATQGKAFLGSDKASIALLGEDSSLNAHWAHNLLSFEGLGPAFKLLGEAEWGRETVNWRVEEFLFEGYKGAVHGLWNRREEKFLGMALFAEENEPHFARIPLQFSLDSSKNGISKISLGSYFCERCFWEERGSLLTLEGLKNSFVERAECRFKGEDIEVHFFCNWQGRDLSSEPLFQGIPWGEIPWSAETVLPDEISFLLSWEGDRAWISSLKTLSKKGNLFVYDLDTASASFIDRSGHLHIAGKLKILHPAFRKKEFSGWRLETDLKKWLTDF